MRLSRLLQALCASLATAVLVTGVSASAVTAPPLANAGGACTSGRSTPVAGVGGRLFTCVANRWQLVTSIGTPGPRGATGATGPRGAAGATGAAGAAGPAGATGAQGPAGPQGDAGPQGPAGATGATGATGAAGATGAQGPQGPAGPATPDSRFGSFVGIFTGTAAAGSGDTCTLGEVGLTAATVAPGTPANGQVLLISQNTALFALIGTNFGGDGRTTFALPDLRSAAPNGLTYWICTAGVFPTRL